LDEARLTKRAAIRDDPHGLRQLQWSNLDVALTDRHVCDVAVEQSAAVRCLHVFVVWHTTFHLAAQRDAALCAKAKLQRPLDDRFGASLDSCLVKPSVARFGERLDKVQSASIAFFPIVIGKVANLN